VLHDERRLVEAQPEVTTVLDGYRYSFSSAEARDKFIADPELYLPVAGGRDVVSLIHTAEPANGTLYHSVWYRDQLFMFLSAENLKNFKSNPQLYVGSLPTVSQR
jgi:YHS domain-containing protein